MYGRIHAFGRTAPETGTSGRQVFISTPLRLLDVQAIARAVYARADFVLLDDVFSALDGETEAYGKCDTSHLDMRNSHIWSTVFTSLFGPDGMLKGKVSAHG